MTAKKAPRVDVVKHESASITTEASASSPKNAFNSFLLAGASIFLVASLFSAPEGAIREGDYLPIVELFLLLLTGVRFCLYRLGRESLERNDDPKNARSSSTLWIDRFLGFFALFATLSYARVAVFRVGDVRLATNAYWTFVAPVAFYFFLRSCHTRLSKGAVVGLTLVVLVGAVVQSACSAYSYAVLNPQLREAYRADPEKMLKENGLEFGSNSRERLLFEKRLLESSEPTGTYGLANTLAGLLAPAFVLALFVAPWKRTFLRAFDKKTSASSRFAALGAATFWTLSLLLILFVLVLTKSRSGVLAVVSGLVLYLLLSLRRFARRDRKTTIRVALGIVAVILSAVGVLIGALAVGIVDQEVFAEAGKSLGYRLDYWRASLAMICDYPLLGIGPGEFQALYARYILPTASEFIADPHNFVFELAALFGIPALIFYGLFLLSLFYEALIGKKNASTLQNACDDETSFERNENASSPSSVPKSVWFGAFLGLVVLLFCAPFQSAPVDFKFLLIAAALFGIAFFAARLLFANVDLEKRATNDVWVATLATALINLCAAGGIGYPSIAVPFFLFAALLANRIDDYNCSSKTQVSPEPKRRILFRVKNAESGALFASVALLLFFHFTAFQPFCRALLFKTRYSLESASTSPYLDALNSGASERVDRFSTPVALQFYYFATRQYFEKPSEQNKALWRKTREQLRKNSPNSAPWRENCADLSQALYERDKTRTEFRDDALEFYRECVERSPTECSTRAKLALFEFEIGEVERAKIDAKEALEQDERTPHEDRKLEDDLKKKLNDALK